MNGTTKKQKVQAAARKLLRDPQFLFKLGERIGAAGVVGEKRNRLLLYLAALTSALEKPVSVAVRGESSTGKSNLVKAVLSLIPSEYILERSSFSARAQAYGAQPLSGKIVYLAERLGGKDARYFTRILQSEGALHHESTNVAGRQRTTTVASRIGMPVFLTTTTETRMERDDETRYLFIQADESPEQTRAVVREELRSESLEFGEPLEVWHEAFRAIRKSLPTFRYPTWFNALAEGVPVSDARARRDVPRFLSLLMAIALCRGFADGRCGRREMKIVFEDYCAGFRILNEAFSSTYTGAPVHALQIAEAVRSLYAEQGRPIVFKELEKTVGWKGAHARKWLKVALQHELVEKLDGTQANNLKLYVPGKVREARFLPHPVTILNACKELGPIIRYVDPVTGFEKKVRRQSAPPTMTKKLRKSSDSKELRDTKKRHETSGIQAGSEE